MSSYLDYFPLLSQNNHKKTSEPTPTYNCIAWAAGDDSRWWQPNDLFDAGYYWPEGIEPGSSKTVLVRLFQYLGYSTSNTSDHTEGYDKVALYASGDTWTHAAKQKPNGKWSSKLGKLDDIEHDTPEAVNCVAYGSVYCIMERKSD